MSWRRWINALLLGCIPFLLLGAVLASNGVFATLHSDTVEHYEYCKSKKTTDDKSDEIEKCQSRAYRALNDPAALATWVLTFVTGALFVVTAGLFYGAIAQSRDARAALRITRQTSERQLRAYLLVEMTVASFEVPDYVLGEVIIKNYGQTPAANVCITRGIDVLPINGKDISSNIKSMPATIIGPQQSQGSIAATQIETQRYKGIVKNINSGTSIVLFGSVTYEDVFGVKRTTLFRYFAAKNTRGGIDFMPCPQGNSYT